MAMRGLRAALVTVATCAFVAAVTLLLLEGPAAAYPDPPPLGFLSTPSLRTGAAGRDSSGPAWERHPHPRSLRSAGPPPTHPLACNTTGISDAAATLRQWTHAGRHPTGDHYVRTLTMGSLAALHPCVTHYEGDMAPSDLVLIVMGSVAKRQRLSYMKRLWSDRAEAAGAHILYISDVADAELGTIALPGATEPSYQGAQNRSLKGMQHAVRTYPEARWYWMVDDDTYFDIGEAVSLLRHTEWRVPLVVGHIFRGILRFKTFAGTWPSGGSGILLSNAAAVDLAGALFTPRCPAVGLNDVLIGKCAYQLDIPLVYHHGFQPEMESYTIHAFKSLLGVAEMGSAVTTHMLAEGDVLERLTKQLGYFKRNPLNESLSWSVEDSWGRRRRR